jgi:hypothetical protein
MQGMDMIRTAGGRAHRMAHRVASIGEGCTQGKRETASQDLWELTWTPGHSAAGYRMTIRVSNGDGFIKQSRRYANDGSAQSQGGKQPRVPHAGVSTICQMSCCVLLCEGEALQDLCYQNHGSRLLMLTKWDVLHWMSSNSTCRNPWLQPWGGNRSSLLLAGFTFP